MYAVVIWCLGDVNPIRDLEIISDELFAKDLQFIDGPLKKAETLFVRAGDKTKKVKIYLLQCSI